MNGSDLGSAFYGARIDVRQTGQALWCVVASFRSHKIHVVMDVEADNHFIKRFRQTARLQVEAK